MLFRSGLSVRRVEDITEALWGSKVSPATISELNKRAYVHIEDWRNRFYRNVFSVVPRSKVKLVAKMLKAIHAQENKKAAREKAKAVVEELRV